MLQPRICHYQCILYCVLYTPKMVDRVGSRKQVAGLEAQKLASMKLTPPFTDKEIQG